MLLHPEIKKHINWTYLIIANFRLKETRGKDRERRERKSNSKWNKRHE